jgi:hypothetical protein
MRWNFYKTIFTNITPLSAAKSGPDSTPSIDIELSWVFPEFFTDPTVSYSNFADRLDAAIELHNPEAIVVNYQLFRHIENTAAGQEDGGAEIDPRYMGPQDGNEPNYHKISTLSSSTTGYVDTFTDLSMHATEGVVYSNGRWIDSEGRDVLKDIAETRRRVFYMIKPILKNMAFNSLPFLFIAHSDGHAECRSTITQCVWNRRFEEGDCIWYRKGLDSLVRTSFDATWDPETDRRWNVWFSTTTGTVYCLDGRDGTDATSYTWSVPDFNITSLKVDPDTGDAIVMGQGDVLYRCVLQDGTVTAIGSQGTTPSNDYSNNGVAICTESGTTNAYSIANHKRIVKWDNINGTPIGITHGLDLATVGDNEQTPALHRNIFGIANGMDQSIWFNCHYAREWTGTFIDSYTSPGYFTAFQHHHHTTQVWTPPTTVYYSKTYTQWILEDIGFINGASEANYQQSTFDASFTNPVNARTGWVESGIYDRFPSGLNSSDAGDQPEPTVAQRGMACDVPFYGNLREFTWLGEIGFVRSITAAVTATYNIWQATDVGVDSSIRRVQVNDIYTNPTIEMEPLCAYDIIWEAAAGIDNDFTLGQLSGNDIALPNDTPYHIAVDSQNCVWSLNHNSTNGLTKAYGSMASAFPGPDGDGFGYAVFSATGKCSWDRSVSPVSLGYRYDYGSGPRYAYDSSLNDPLIEWILTRSVVPVATADASSFVNNISSFGIKINGANRFDEIRIAREYGAANPGGQSGCRVYPNYNDGAVVSFPYTDSTNQSEYNSDNTGMCLALTNKSVEGPPSFIRPPETYPISDLSVSFKESTPLLTDGDFWRNQHIESSDYKSLSGYDDLTIQLSAVKDHGTFGIPTWNYIYEDRITDIGSGTNPISSGEIVSNIHQYKYHDPSQSGKPLNRRAGAPGEETGYYAPSAQITYHINPYLVSGIDIESVSGVNTYNYDSVAESIHVNTNNVSVYVWERWPTAQFYVQPFSPVGCIPAEWDWTPPTIAVGDNEKTDTDPERVIWGYDPLSAQFTDHSISRTWPLCEWHWDFGDDDTFGGFDLPDLAEACGGVHVTTATLLCTDPAFHPRDNALTTHPNLTSHMYKAPGTYYATLWVRASNTGTDSWNISANVTDEAIMASTFTVAATREIEVREICPKSWFYITSGMTVLSSYSDEQGSFYDPAVSGTGLYLRSDNLFASGFAPNVTLQFNGSAVVRSLPLSSFTWDFGDFYSDGASYNDSWGNRDNHPTEITSLAAPTTGWPTWTVPGGYVTQSIHTFVMPGFYTVSLYPDVSAIPQHTMNCGPCAVDFCVYVEELDPVASFASSLSAITGYSSPVSGTAPLSVYFNPSATMPGSFPIGVIDWDFGDGTMESYSRNISSNYTFTSGATAFPTDLADPRNVIVDHTYTRTNNTQPSSYVVSMSAYAANTSTVSIVTGEVGPIELITFFEKEGDFHLISNRMYGSDDDIIYTLEGETQRQTYSVLLSSSVL